jgi:hypothetical protein
MPGRQENEIVGFYPSPNSRMTIFLALFVFLVIAVLIAATVFISLPSKVLGDIEQHVKKAKANRPADPTQQTDE